MTMKEESGELYATHALHATSHYANVGLGSGLRFGDRFGGFP
jgi:hypothetical protein